MEFLKKHYEKVLLGVVLLGLLGAVACLPFIISREQEKMTQITTTILNPRVKPLTNLDLSLPNLAISRASSPMTVDFGPPNRLFNPLVWQQTPEPDKRLIPKSRVGPDLLIVTNITPLYLKLSLDSFSVSETGNKYIIGIEKPGATGALKSKTQDYCTLNPPTANKTFKMIEVKGKPEDPQVVVQLLDTQDKVVLSTNQPYRRIEGYMADLRYEPERKSWPNTHVSTKTPLSFNGEDYYVVSIGPKEVVLEAKANKKRWTLIASAKPTP